MSFWTDVCFVRPTKPPTVTVAELMAFTTQIARSGLVEPSNTRVVKLKLGKSIDADRVGTLIEQPIGDYMSTYSEIEWDIQTESAAEIELLANDSRQVYRAYIAFGFGSLRTSISEALRTQTPDGNPNLLLGDVSIQCGPVEGGALNEEPVHVGWMSVGFGGQGYLWPWQPADLLARVKADPHLAIVEKICRSMFPLRDVARPSRKWFGGTDPSPNRKELGEYWPFTTDWPNDWAWAIRES